jgi:hypothetical protein
MFSHGHSSSPAFHALRRNYTGSGVEVKRRASCLSSYKEWKVRAYIDARLFENVDVKNDGVCPGNDPEQILGPEREGLAPMMFHLDVKF